MKFQNKCFIIGLILLLILGISAVSARENLTNHNTDDVNYVDDEIGYKDNVLNQHVEDAFNDNELLSIDANDSDKLEATKSISTKITVNPVTVNEGTSFTFTAHVKADNGMTVPGQVIFKCGNEFTKDLDSTGSAKITFKGTLPPNLYSWTASYLGGTTTSESTTYKFLTSTTTIKLTVMGNAIVTAEDYTSFYQSGEKYKIRVTNNYTHAGISNKKIKVLFYTDPNKYTTSYYYTNNDGVYEETVNNLPGNYKIVANLVDDYYNSNPVTFNISIDKTPIKLFVNQITSNYPYATLKLTVTDVLGNKINSGRAIFSINGNTHNVNVNNGFATKKIKLSQGTYNCIVSFSGDNCYSNNTSFNVVVKKANVKLTTYKWISTTKSYATLKTIVKDASGKKVNEGIVIFTINGKTYKVNVKNGIATKNIKLNKAKTYKYKATYSASNYNTKKASSKIIVKPTRNYYAFKYGKLVGKITYKQYISLLNAYNNGKYKVISVQTGKFNTYKVPAYKTVKITKKVWKYKKVLRSEYWSWDGGSEWKDYNTWEKYTKKGWTWYGTADTEKSYSDGSYYSAMYYKLKKKVQVTENKKVRNGYKYAKYPIKMWVVSTEGYNGFSIEFYDSYGGYLGGGLKNII